MKRGSTVTVKVSDEMAPYASVSTTMHRVPEYFNRNYCNMSTLCVHNLLSPPPSPLQSALAREQELETKLASMQSVLNVARELATDSMIVSLTAPKTLSASGLVM